MKKRSVCFINNNFGRFSDHILSDVTLVFADGKVLKADKLMLCLNNPYFDNIFKVAPNNDGLILMKDFC